MYYLDENLSNGDKRSAELCGEQAADEEVPQLLSMVVAQIHGIDVKDHVGHSKQYKPVHQPVTVK